MKKEGKIIAISNLKGGVGKTSIVQNLGAELFNRGKRILYIDMDSQQNLSLILKGSGRYKSIYEVLTTQDTTGAIQSTSQGDLIRGEAAILTLKEVPGEALKKALEKIKTEYDYILIDTPPTYNAIINSSLIAADEILIPCETDLFSFQGIDTQKKIIDEVKKKLNKKLKIRGIIVNKYEGRSNHNKQILETIQKKAEEMGAKVYTIRKNVAISKAQAFQQNIFEFDNKSNGAADYKTLVGEILENG